MSEHHVEGYLDSSLEAPALVHNPSGPPVYSGRLSAYSLLRYNSKALLLSFSVLGLLLAVGTGAFLLGNRSSTSLGSHRGNGPTDYSVGNISLSGLGMNPLEMGKADHLTINGQLNVNGGFVLSPADAPKNAVLGQIYFDQASNKPYYFDGTNFVCLIQNIPQAVASIGGATGVIGLGSGLQLRNGTIGLSDAILQGAIAPQASGGLVSSVQGQTGAVSFTGGNGIAVNGTSITNTGVLSIGGVGGNLGLGRGLAMQGGAIKTTVSLTSGSANLVIADDGNGNYSITDTSPAAGGTGGVTLGPVTSQSDPSGNNSVNIDKTSAGNFLRLASSGIDKFVIDQTGTITTGSIAYAKVTGAPATTVTSLGGATGAISLGSGLTIAGATLSNSGVVSLSGTPNQITASSSTGVITLSLPQAIATTSNPSFNNLSLVGTLSVAGAVSLSNTLGVAGLTTLSSGALISGNVNINTTGVGSTTVGNAGATFAVLSSGLNVTTGGALSGITTLNASGAIVAASAGNTLNGLIVNAGSLSGVTGYVQTSGNFSQSGSGSFTTGTGTATIGSLSSGLVLSNTSGVLSAGALDRNNATYFSTALSTGNGGTGSTTAAGGRTNLGAAASGANSDLTSLSAVTSVGSNGTALTLQGNASSVFSASAGGFSTSLGFASPTANVSYILPTATAGTYNICTTVGNCAGTGGGVTTAGGTSGKLAKFTGAQTLGDSLLSESGTTVTVGGILAVNSVAPSAALLLGVTAQNVTVQGAAVAITSTSGANTNSLTFATPAGSSHSVTVPNANGTVAVSASGPLAIDSNGNLTCASCTTSGGGAGGAVDSLNTINGSVSLQGTANQIVVTNNFGIKTITLSTPQDINTSSSPTFSTLTLSNTLSVTNAITAGSLATGGTLTVTGSATAASFNGLNLTATANGFSVAGGTAVKTVTVTNNVTLDQNLATTASPTFNALTLGTALGVGSGGTGSTSAAGARTNLGAAASGSNSDITSLTGLTTALSAGQGGTGINGSAAANGKLLIGNGSGYTLANLTQGSGISIINGGGSITIAVDGTICTTSGNCAGAGTGVTTAGGTINKIAFFTGSQAIGDSLLSQSGATITATGNLTATSALQGNTLNIGSGTFTVNASGAITAATGVTTSGAITFSSLNTVGVLHTNGTGLLSTGGVILGSETTGNYVATLGVLTGLTTTGNSGAGSSPTLSVAYGSTSNSAAQGNTVLSFTGAGNLTGSVSGSAGGGFSSNSLDVISNPTFAGSLTTNGGLTVASNSNITQTGSGTFSSGTGAVALNGAVTIAAGKSISFVGGITSTRPAAPSTGMLYFDTTTNQMLQYNGSKWLSDRNSSTKIVAANNSSQALKDSADYVASGAGDQAIINTALTAASGGSVYLAEGTYIVNAPITVPNNTTLSGSGAGTVITIPNALNGSFNIITNNDTTTGTHITIHDLLIDGNKANQTAGTGKGIYLIGMGGGTGSSARDGAEIRNTYIKNLINGIAISVVNSNNNIISGNSVVGNPNLGIYLNNSSNNIISANNVQGNNFGIYVGTSSNNNSVTGNTSQGNSYGIYIYSSSANVVTGNTAQGNSNYGILLDMSADNNNVSGNNVQGNTNYGIGIYGSSNSITGNKLYDNGGAGTNNAIYLNTATNNTIVGNDITDSSCTGSCFAINISDAASTGNLLSANRLSSPETLNDLASNTNYNGQTNGNGDLILKTTSGKIGINTLTPSEALNVYNGNLQVDYGNIKLNQVVAPGALTASINPAAGNLNAFYQYQVSYVSAQGETNLSLGAVVNPANQQVDLTNIPVSANTTVLARKIYRSKAGAFNGPFYLVTTINDNVTTTYTDNATDASLGTAGSIINTTGGTISVNNSRALYVSTGNDASVYLGKFAGLGIKSGNYNTGIGTGTLQSNITGQYNAALGFQALQQLTSGAYNVALGASALQNATSGNSNISIGYQTLFSNSGSSNVAVGDNALMANTSAGNNVALGSNALSSNTTGDNNIAIGASAGGINTIGQNNIYIGYLADAIGNNLSQSVAIGYQAKVSQSNSIILGGTGSYAAKIGVGTAAPSATFEVKTGVNTTAALQVTNAAGSGILSIDTVNNLTTLTAGVDVAAVGAELFTGSYSFPTTAGWTSISGTGSSATATHVSGGGTTTLNVTPSLSVSAGKYKLTYSYSFNGAGGSVYATIGGANGTFLNSDVGSGSSGTIDSVINTSGGNLSFLPSNTSDVTISNVSLTNISSTMPSLTVKNSSNIATLEVRSGGTASSNTFVGLASGSTDSTGYNNTGFGSSALANNLTGYGNTAVGNAALQSNVSGLNNTAVGNYALSNVTSTSNNSAFGFNALSGTTTGANNAAFGSFSMVNNTSGFNNTSFGVGSLQNNTSGSFNSAMGYQALVSNTIGGSNIANGYLALGSNTTGSYNVGIGQNAGRGISTGTYNTGTGYSSLYSTTNGVGNAGYGEGSLYTNTTGSYNTGIGYGTDVNASNLTNATAVGAYALASSSNSLVLGSINGVNGATSSAQIGIGTSAPSATLEVKTVTNTTTALQVTNAAGAGVLTVDTTANQLTIAGNINLAQIAAPGSAPIVAVGSAGNLSGTYYYVVSYVTASGITNYGPVSASISPSSQQVNLTSIPISPSALVTGRRIYRGTSNSSYSTYNLVTTINNNTSTTYTDNLTSLGSSAAIDNRTGTLQVQGSTVLDISPNTNNVWIGLSTGVNNSGGYNTAVGDYALQNNSSGMYNTATGPYALWSNSSGSNNAAYGASALQSNTTGAQNTALGFTSLQYNTTGSQNTASGTNSLQSNTTGTANTANGYAALGSNTTGVQNTATGAYALTSNTSGIYNTAVGSFNLQNNTGGSNNTALGYNSLSSNTTGFNNTANGFNALHSLQTLSGTISATTNNGGNAQFTTLSTTGLSPGANVTIAGTTSYNGVKTVISINSATQFTVGAPYSSADTTGTWTTGDPIGNTATGYQAGQGSGTGYSATGNSLYGNNTGFALQTGGDYNTIIGFNAGVALTYGKQNTILGYNSGTALTTGNNNIVIGQSVEVANATGSNQLNIGNLLTGDLSSGFAAFKGLLALGSANTSNGKLALYSATNSGSITLQGASTAGNYTLSVPATIATNDTLCLQTLANCSGAGITAVGALDAQAKNANGATINGSSVYLQTADATNPGLVTAGAQTLAGAKTLSGALQVNNTTTISTTSAVAFQVQDAGGSNTIFKIDTSTGALTVKSSGNSAVALQVLDSTGNVVFVIDANNKRVGINTGVTAPGANLSVNGTNNINPSYPDGLVGTPVTAQISGSYTVPVGKTLYITSISNGNASAQSVVNGTNYGPVAPNSAISLNSPISVAASATISSSLNGTMYVTGYLTNSNGYGGP